MNHLGLCQPAVHNMQPHHGLDLLKTLPASGTGIDEQHPIQVLDAFDLKNMTVAADEYIRRINGQLLPHAPLPSSWATGYMGHPEPDSGHFETVMSRIGMSQIPSVYISPHGSHGSNGRQFVNQLNVTDITGMKNEIYILQIVEQVGMQPTVGIGQDANNGATGLRHRSAHHESQPDARTRARPIIRRPGPLAHWDTQIGGELEAGTFDLEP